MVKRVFVGSRSNSDVVVPVEERGLDSMEVQRRAIQFVRARHRIADPIPLTEHDAAVRMRQRDISRFAPKMNVAALNGPQIPFWRSPRRLEQFLENPQFYGN